MWRELKSWFWFPAIAFAFGAFTTAMIFITTTRYGHLFKESEDVRMPIVALVVSIVIALAALISGLAALRERMRDTKGRGRRSKVRGIVLRA